MKGITKRLLALLMALCMLSSLLVTAGATEDVAQESSGNTLTEEEANALLAGAGTSVVQIALDNHLDDVNTTQYGLCGGTSHLQGICVDEKLEYMYFSYTTALAKIDIKTGKLVASVVNFGPGGFDMEGGAHLGCIDYYNGHIYGSLEYKSPGKKFFLAIFDADKMTAVGMDVNNMPADQKVITGVLLSEPTMDFRDPLDTEVFTGQDAYGDAANEENNGHRFACSGIDGVTMGKWPGGGDDEIYMIVAYGVYGGGKFENRYDNMYNVLQFYKLSDLWQEEGNTWNIPFNGKRGLEREIGEGEALTAARTLYVYTGNTQYGAQNIEYEWDTGDIVLYTYGNTDGFGGTMYVVDGSKTPEYKTLELGQNNTLKAKADRYFCKWVAEAYATDTNGNGTIEEDEFLKGDVAVLKCICGDPQSHSAETVGEAEWDSTGVKKADQPICSTNHPASATTGIAWIGGDPQDDSVDYFYVANGAYTTGLYKRTVNSKGVSFKQLKWLAEEELTAKPVMQWTMDAADLAEDGKITNAVNAETYGGYCANVAVGDGVDGKMGGSLYFDGRADALDYSRAWMSEEGVAALQKMVNETGEITISYWYKPQYNGSDNFTSNWAPILGIYSSNAWSQGPGRFMLVTEDRGGLTMCMNNFDNKMDWPVDIRSATSSGASSANDWHHIVMTVDLNTTDAVTYPGNGGTSLYRRFYIDGIEVKQERALYPENKDTVLTGMTDFEIGGAPFKCWSDTNIRGRFSGWIDDVQVYDTAVTAKQAAYLMQHVPATPDKEYVEPQTPETERETAYVFDKAAPADLTIPFVSDITSVSGVTEGCYRVDGKNVVLSADFLRTRQPGALTVTINGKDNVKENVKVNVLNSAAGYPVAYYKLDSAADGKTADASGNGLDAQVINGVAINSDGAAFNGYAETVVQRVQLADSDLLAKALANKATISFWFQSSRIVGNMTDLVGLYGADAQPALVAQFRSSGGERQGNNQPVNVAAQTLSAASRSWDDNVVSGAGITVNGDWHQMTVSYDGEKAYVYLDGKLSASGAALADNLKSVDSLVLGGPVNIGYVTPGSSKSQTYQTNFYGNLDEVLLYNTTLTEDEVAAIYAAGRDGITLPVDTTGLAYLVDKAEALGEAAPADALAAAKAVLDKQDATAQEVTEASDALLRALNALTDKTALRAAVEKADAMTKGNYTDETWSALEEALAAAKAVLNDFQATQAQVDAAKAALDAAVAGLKEKSNPTPTPTPTPTPSEPKFPFTDVAEDSIFRDAIAWAAKKGITTGKTETTFDPNGTCTRGQVVTFLWRMVGSPEPKTVEMPFTDVVAGSYCEKAVLWAVENGVTKGVTETSFQPDAAVKRGEAVTFLWRMAGSPEAENTMPFTDVAAGSYCEKAVLWAVKTGVTTGVTETSFQPGTAVSRAQLVAFLYRSQLV